MVLFALAPKPYPPFLKKRSILYLVYFHSTNVNVPLEAVLYAKLAKFDYLLTKICNIRLLGAKIQY